jgi:NodT family efflux transporter outer membrane factor (OMF) lipoprotein
MAAVGCLSACASMTAPKPAVLPAAYEATAALAFGGAALQRWWMSFGDPNLSASVEAALAASPDARTARARLREARAIRASALTAYGPQGEPSLTVARQGARADDLDAHTRVVDLAVSWEIDFLGRGRAARHSADAALEAALYDEQAARAVIAAAAAQAYFDVHGLERQRDEAIETARIAQELSRLAQLKVERQLISRADAALLSADAASARARQQALAAQEQAARRTLLVLLGQAGAPRESLVVTAGPIVAPPPPSAAPGDLLSRRPDLLSAERQVRVAAGSVVSAKLAYLPTLSLRPQMTQTTTLGQGASLWALAANATTPLLDLPRLRAQVRIADARAEQAVIAYEQAVQVAYGEADRALLQLAADRARLVDLAEAETQAKAAFDSQNQAYRAGYADLPDLLLAERAWRAARANLTAGQNAVLAGTVTAFKALGGGWSAPAASAAAP